MSDPVSPMARLVLRQLGGRECVVWVGLAIILCLAAGACPLVSTTVAESLPEALGAAYAYNPRLDAQRAFLWASDEDVARATSGYRPAIGASADYGVKRAKTKPPSLFDGTSKPHGFRVDGVQPIFRGFQTYNAVNAAEANVRSEREVYRNAESRVLLDAVTAYMDVVRDKEVVRLNENNVNVLSRELTATQDRFSVGEVTRTDVAQAEARRALAVWDIDSARANLRTNRGAFLQVIDNPPNNLFDWALQTLLHTPAWVVIVLCGIGFSLVGRRRPAGVSFAAGQVKAPLPTLSRVCGLGVLIASVALVVFDLSQNPQPQKGVVFTTLSDGWHQLHPGNLEDARTAVQGLLPQFWDPGLQTVLRLPAWLVIGLIGLGLYRVGVWRRDAAIKVAAGAEDPRFGASSQPSVPQVSPRSELAHALSSCRSAFLCIGLFSGMSNLLMLTGAFFMLQIYDRVLPSRSVPTLVALAILVAFLFAALAILDMIRSRILVRIGTSLDNTLSARVYDTIVRRPLRMGNRGDGLQPLRDLDSVRAFLSSPGPTALFDLPWIPLYLVIIFAFHTALGITALIGAIVLIMLTLLTEALARQPIREASGFAQTRNGIAEAGRRNAEVLAAMGMAGRINSRWSEANESYLVSQQKASDVTGGFGSVSKSLRMMLQSAVLGLGAYLVINQVATAGIIIAAAILVARALAPVDLAIANWKGFLAARQGWTRLTQVLELFPAHKTPMALPAPGASLAVEHASSVPPGQKKVVVQDMSFTLESGQGLGIIGPSASGKSSLVRMIVGAWHPARGQIRLDGAALDQWSPEALGRHIGYLPQDVELFSATVAENIARFEPDAASDVIINAAQAAGVHDLIVALPQGYETEIGEQGQVLSAGQRQRIALARALYRDPFLVVLDEPNSNLDAEGEAALTQAILGVRGRGGIIVVVAHRPSALAGADLVLVMANGSAVSFGPKDEVLSKVLAQRPASQRGQFTVVLDAGTKT